MPGLIGVDITMHLAAHADDRTAKDDRESVAREHAAASPLTSSLPPRRQVRRALPVRTSPPSVCCHATPQDNLLPVNKSWHPPIEDVVYWGMDWICPNDNRMLAHQVHACPSIALGVGIGDRDWTWAAAWARGWHGRAATDACYPRDLTRAAMLIPRR